MLRNGMQILVSGARRLRWINETVSPKSSANTQSNLVRFSTSTRLASHRFDKSVIDRTHLATYDEIVDLPNHPNVLLIDVREPSELSATGHIPTSINIPLNSVSSELQLAPEAFAAKYGRKKPSSDDPIIFSCRLGVRSGNAAHEADQLGFKRVKNYAGSWLEYAEKQGLPS